MAFLSNMNEKLVIDKQSYLLAEHPQAPGVPYGQEGRQGIVYLLQSEKSNMKKAMKVFRAKFANPSLVSITEQLRKFTKMNGLQASDRMVITPHDHPALLEQYPDLLYAVLMPWIEGPTWMDMLLNGQRLTRRQSYKTAFAFAEIMVMMEQRGIAHCDLSAPNVMLPAFSDASSVRSSDHIQLIDLEQMYAPQFSRPEYVPSGSPGYAPRHKESWDLWNPHADRFAGAILLMEMLGACEEAFAAHAWGESFFDPEEIQTSCDRYDILVEAVSSTWGEEFAALFERAWNSTELIHCPTFGDWMVAMSKIEPSVYRDIKPTKRQKTSETTTVQQVTGDNKLEQLLTRARDYEASGNYQEAIKAFQSVKLLNPHESLVKEVEIAVAELEEKIAASTKLQTNRKTYRKLRKSVLTGLLCMAIAAVGYFAYPLINQHNLIRTEAYEAKVTELASVSEELADTRLLLTQVHTQLEELKKPLADRKKELVEQLNDHYHEVKEMASYSHLTPNIEKQTFEKAKAYIDYILEYVRLSFDLDPQFTAQFDAVSGYYYPYLYNENRNAQLNLQFFQDYKDKF